jgi:solute carrier family 8 (sodium/calcium exchanger)
VQDYFEEHHPNGTPLSSKKSDKGSTKVFFDPGHYTIMEDVGELVATVKRQGGNLNQVIMVDYRTEDADGVAGKDYVAAAGTLTFESGQTFQNIRVKIIDDPVYEGDLHFYIRLFNLRTHRSHQSNDTKGVVAKDAYAKTSVTPTGSISRRKSNAKLPHVMLSDHIVTTSKSNNNYLNVGYEKISRSPSNASTKSIQVVNGAFDDLAPCLVCPSLATVLIMDDDHHGIFSLNECRADLVESVGSHTIRIFRIGGAKGRVVLPYRTEEGTASPTNDYIHTEGEVIFEEGETE